MQCMFERFKVSKIEKVEIEKNVCSETFGIFFNLLNKCGESLNFKIMFLD